MQYDAIKQLQYLKFNLNVALLIYNGQSVNMTDPLHTIVDFQYVALFLVSLFELNFDLH